MDIRAFDDMRPKDDITKTFLVNMRYYMELTGNEDFSYLEDTGISQQIIRDESMIMCNERVFLDSQPCFSYN